MVSTPPQDELIHLAQRVRACGWSAPVVILLQVIAPLGFLCAQIITMLAPLVMPQGQKRSQRWVALLEDPEQLERLRQLIQTPDAV